MKEDKLSDKKQVHDKLNYTEQQLILVTHEMKDKIRHMVEDVEQRVSTALSEEIRRLSSLVDEFSLPFHTEPLVLNVYKKELHLHVENGLGSNLRARLSTALALNIESSQREMYDRMEKLLPEEKRRVMITVLPRREPFEILYRLNCDNLCADFHEDLEFKFSWGIMALIQRFVGSNKKSKKQLNYLNNRPYNYNPNTSIPMSPTDYEFNTSSTNNSLIGSINADDWSFLSRVAVASMGSQGTIGGLLLAGFVS